MLGTIGILAGKLDAPFEGFACGTEITVLEVGEADAFEGFGVVGVDLERVFVESSARFAMSESARGAAPEYGDFELARVVE